MRLLYIADVRLPTEKAHGGAIMRACSAFAENGIEVELLVPSRGNFIYDSPFAYYDVRDNFRITRISIPKTLSFGRFGFLLHTFFFSLRSAWYVRQAKPNVIYSRDALPLLLVSYIASIPIFWEMHFARWSRMIALLSKRINGLICISKNLADFYKKRGLDAARVLVAPSGVDLLVFDVPISKEDARTQLGIQLDAKVMVYTGNFTTLCEDKGISDILRALTLIPEAQFIAIGGNEPDRKRYEKEAEAAGVLGQTRFLGHASQATLAIYQKAADILLMPFPDTPHYRSAMSPIKTFEYMASGRPIIASDLPTIREVLNESNAIIVPPGDDKALAKAMDSVLNDPVHSNKIAEQALQDVQNYSWALRASVIIKCMNHTII